MVVMSNLKVGDRVLAKMECSDRKGLGKGVVVYVHPNLTFAVVRIGNAYNESFFSSELYLDEPDAI